MKRSVFVLKSVLVLFPVILITIFSCCRTGWGETISGIVFYQDTTTPFDQAVHIDIYQQDPCNSPEYIGGTVVDSITGIFTITQVPVGEFYVKIKNAPHTSAVPLWWNSSGGTLDCNRAEQVAVTQGQGLTGLMLTTQQGAIVSGTVYEADGITPVPEGWGVIAQRFSDLAFMGGSHIGSDGTYQIRGLPPGDYIIRAEPARHAHTWYDNTRDIQKAFIFTATGTEHFTGIDFTMTYPILVQSVNSLRSDGTFSAGFAVYFWRLNNFDIQRVESLTLLDPLGNRYHYTRGGGDQNDFTVNQWNGFTLILPGTQPELGVYTFHIVTDDFSTTFTHTRTVNNILPIVDGATLSPADNSILASEMPVFEWSSVTDPGMAVYYRLQIYDDTGFRVFASRSEAGWQSVTLPTGLLTPGRTYTWRVDLYDDPDNNKPEINKSEGPTFTLTMADTLTTRHPAFPAIDPVGFGAASWRSTGWDGTMGFIKVIDHDGISYDGASHQVSIRINGTDHPLYHVRSLSAFESYYEYWDPGNQAQSGDYVFTVTDPAGNTAFFTDTLTAAALPVPDPAFFNIAVDGTCPTISWEPVPGAVRYPIRIFDLNWNRLWEGNARTDMAFSFTVPPGILEPNTHYRYQVRAYDGRMGFQTHNGSVSEQMPFTTGEASIAPFIEPSHGAAIRTTPDQGTYLYFHVKIHDAGGVPGNIASVIAAFPDGTQMPLSLESLESPTCGTYSADAISLPAVSGDYTITVINQNSFSFSMTDTLEVNPIGYPADGSIDVTVSGTRAAFTWEDIPEAAFYRLELYSMDHQRLYTFTTCQTDFTLPEGYLKEHTAYQYRITTWREFLEQNVNNNSRSVMKGFQTGTDQKTDILLTAAAPDVTLSEGDRVTVYGTATANHIILESGVRAEMINFPGQNLIEVQSGATLFTVSRFGTMVTFQGSDGTRLKIPATMDEQTIMFNEKGPLVLRIHENQVRLNDQVIGRSPALIAD